jgi:hypothetical protein
MDGSAEYGDGGPYRAVFMSYARRSSRTEAEGLFDALGGEQGGAFIDSTEIDAGEDSPTGVMDALMAAHVVVVFADVTYFSGGIA